MPSQEILGGLRHALNKGETLEKAMTSFYNAGYEKGEIEEAARFIQQGGTQISPPKETNLPKRGQIEETKSTPVQLEPKSKISSYGQEKYKKPNPVKKAGKWLLTAIIIVAIIFVGLLIAFLVTT